MKGKCQRCGAEGTAYYYYGELLCPECGAKAELEPHHVECIKCGLVKATLRTKAKMRCDRGHHMWIFKKGELPHC